MMEKVNRTCNDCAFRGHFKPPTGTRFCTKFGEFRVLSTAINCEDFLQTTAPDEPKKYIDADKIHDVIASHFCACSDETEAALHSVWNELKAIPMEDVAEVIRCKDCGNYRTGKLFGSHWCEEDGRCIEPDFYCANAQRLEATP